MTTTVESAVMARLNKFTYAILHNPNCPKPFEVRMVGRRAGVLDYIRDNSTKDILGHGMTMEEAAESALAKK